MTTDTNPSRPTFRLADIAAEAKVSPATVSKVLNGHRDVSAATRTRIEDLLEARGYARRAGPATRSSTIEVVFHELDAEWAIEIIRGVGRVTHEVGASLMLTESGDRHRPGADWLDGVLRRRPLGVIFVFSALADAGKAKLRRAGINFVVVDPSGEPAPDVASIGSANWAGGYAAAQHLIELGHRRIATITGPRDLICSVARNDGYASALRRAGLEVDPKLIVEGDFHVSGGRAGAERLLDGSDPPTAIFAGSDLQAIGVYEAARARGLRVPEDLSVVGYDDLSMTQWLGPPLTTVRQPLAEMAETAARLLLEMTAHPDGPHNQRVDLATELIVRGSTAAPAVRPVVLGRRPASG